MNFLRKLVVGKPMNSIPYKESQKYLKLDSMGRKDCLSFISYQPDILISLRTMKTTANSGKSQKYCRKVLEESVEAIEIISFFSKTLSMIF